MAKKKVKKAVKKVMRKAPKKAVKKVSRKTAKKGIPILFGQFLLNNKAITPRQLIDAIQAQLAQHQLFGEVGRKLSGLSDGQVAQVISAIHGNRRSRYKGMKFGEAAYRMGFITVEDIAAIIDIQINSRKKIGEILMESGALTAQACEQHLKNYAEWRGSRMKSPIDPD